jgi:signal transduction histidine kinase
MTGHEPSTALHRVPHWIIDVALAGLIVAQAVFPFPSEIGEATPLGTVAILLPAALLPMRRRHPLVILASCVTCFAIAAFAAPMAPSAFLATAIAMYAVAVQTDRRTTITTALAVLVVVVPLTVLTSGASAFEALPIQGAVTVGFAAALGDGVRNRRAYIAEITTRALHAEATRESEASRRVAEERLRIARDLHDVVAHQISVISLNAGVATTTLDARPDAAREALATIREAARRVLGEIGGLLAVLRSEDEQSRSPQPGLAQLDPLVEDFAASGIEVSIRSENDISALPPAVDVIAYRILQEALTNALKHGSGGRAHLLIDQDRDNLRLVVTNPVADPTTDPPSETRGHGLQGIRERVVSLHGQTDVSIRGGTFRLEVALPIGQPPEDPQ